jgi:hypothetical protein
MGRSVLDRALPAAGVALLLLGMTSSPAEAKERRSETVRVDLKSGTWILGDLLAVGDSALAVLGADGSERRCRFEEIRRVVVKSAARRFPWGFVGFAAGAGVGYAVGANPHNWPHSDDTRILNGIGKGLLWGALGAIAGTLAAGGGAKSREIIFPFENLDRMQLLVVLERLRKHIKARDRL